MARSYIIIGTKRSGYVWSIPEQLMNTLKLQPKDTVMLSCGAVSIGVTVHKLGGSRPGIAGLMGLSADVLQALHIPPNISLQVQETVEKQFRLGPVIGLLTFPGHVPGRLGYYGVYARRLKHKGLLYVFRGRGINVRGRTISGYYWDPAGRAWVMQDLPFPDAVIDRIYPNIRICHVLLESLMGPGKIFNRKSMIDKVDFCKALSPDPCLKYHVPETRVMQDPSDLHDFLKRYPEVFLKPVNGMKGHGIIAIKRNAKGMLNCTYNIRGKYMTKQLDSTAQIKDVIISAAGRERTYIIQQGISRLDYEGGPLSFRTWAMKNGKGQWVMPGLFAKAAVGEGFLTNFTAGARLVPLAELFPKILPRLPYTKGQLLSLLADITLKTAAVLDKTFGPLGELGLDVVFDKTGWPWLIEANGNPGNIPVFIQKEYPAWRHLVFQYPVDYAVYLAGFAL